MIGRYALSKSSLQYFVRHTTTCVNNFLIYNVSAFFYSIHDSENYSFLWSLPKESQSCLIMIYIILKHFYHVGRFFCNEYGACYNGLIFSQLWCFPVVVCGKKGSNVFYCRKWPFTSSFSWRHNQNLSWWNWKVSRHDFFQIYLRFWLSFQWKHNSSLVL